ncbi:MAG: ATP-binding protein [Bacillota bacterium]
MKKKIYSSLCTISIIIVVLTSLATLLVYYNMFINQVKEDLKSQTSIIANNLNHSRQDYEYLENLEKVSGNIHITLVSPDDKVIYESPTDVPNNNRQIFIMAQKHGYGEFISKSPALGYNTYYYARKLNNNSILCISTETSNFGSIFINTLPIICLIIALVFFVGMIFSAKLTKKIVQSMEDMADHIDNANDYPFYDELAPFINKIRKQNQQIKDHCYTLRKERDIINTITDNMQEGLILIDNNRNILSVNKSAIKLLAAQKDDYTGKHILTLSRSSEIIESVNEVLAGNNISTIYKNNDKYYRIFLNPVHNNHKINGAMILIVDVTKQQQAEKIRHDFTANVSHELKTPLTSIYGFAEMIEKDMVSNKEDLKKFAVQICKESLRMISLIDDIIRLSQIEDASTKQLEKVNIYQICQEVISSLQLIADQKQIELKLTDQPAFIYANPQMIDELIYNLCDNAIKYNKIGGSVHISTYNTQSEAVISVKDTGIGISDADQDRIFERFYRVDKSRSKATGGTGLGLSIVKHIVEYHKGNIKLESTLDRGTNITVTLPII